MPYSDQVDIDWYRPPIEKDELNALMVRSDFRGWVQTLLHLGLLFFTAALAYAAFLNINEQNLVWSVPLLLIALFVHGTLGPSMGLIAIHELQHRTVFKTRKLNEIFEVLYAFISWSDYVSYQQSHARHHRGTCHRAHDGEIILPQKISTKRFQFWLAILAWNPLVTVAKLIQVWRHANGKIDGEWPNYILDNEILRTRHRNWARTLLVGHGLLALAFIFSSHWFLIVVFTIDTQYCSWLGFLAAIPQHIGMNSDEPDFRLSTRTYTCSKLLGFYYWNMQYHLEHHMYPAVPFYQLPTLRASIEHDLPIATHGLFDTWREISEIRANAKADPEYRFTPKMPA